MTKIRNFELSFESSAGHRPTPRSFQQDQISEDWLLGTGVLSGQKPANNKDDSTTLLEAYIRTMT
jgi:hypothetical protein